MFWIDGSGEIQVSSVGWVKSDFEQINRMMGSISKAAPAVVFKPDEDFTISALVEVRKTDPAVAGKRIPRGQAGQRCKRRGYV